MNAPKRTIVGPGTVLKGKYRLEALLGAGGMAEVYRARNVLVDRDVAIKVLRRELAGREEAVARFMREAKAAGAVRHRNIVDVLDIDTSDDGVMFIVQEYLEGEDLAARIKRAGHKLAPREALDLLLPVAEALGVAHAQGIVHRDLKPDNVFLAREGADVVPKVLDFGISKLPLHDELRRTAAGATAHRLTAVGAAMGTPYYMSPEQIRDPSTVDARTDVWSLGVVFYEALTGQMPFDADELSELFGLICSGQPHPIPRVAPEVPAALARVVHRCLSADRERRFADGRELARALARAAESLRAGAERAPLSAPSSAPRSGPTAGPPSERRGRRKHSGRFQTYDPNRDPRAESTASIPASTSAPPPEEPAPSSPPRGDLLELPELDLDLGPTPSVRRAASSRAPVSTEPPEEDEGLPSGMSWDEDEAGGIELEAAPDLTATAPPAAAHSERAPRPSPSASAPSTTPASTRSDEIPVSRRVEVRRHRAAADPVAAWRVVRMVLALALVATVAAAARYGTPEGLTALHAALGPNAPIASLAAAIITTVGAIWVGAFALRLPAVSLFVATAGLLVAALGSAVAAAVLASPGLTPVVLRKAALVAWPWAAMVALAALGWFAISFGRDLARLGDRVWAVLAFVAAASLVLPIGWLARTDWPGVAEVSRLEVGLTPLPAERTAQQLGVVYEGARALPPPTPLPIDGAVSRGAGALGR